MDQCSSSTCEYSDEEGSHLSPSSSDGQVRSCRWARLDHRDLLPSNIRDNQSV
jgi:hypothetical protein